MKSKTIYTIIGAIVFIVVVVIWKLNSYYKQEKSAQVEAQIHQQNITLKTSVSSQLAQLKNIISSYQGQIDESKINWVQINPFFTLAQIEIADNGTYSVKNLFTKSGSAADNWSKDYLQKALSYSSYSQKELHGQLFQNQAGEKFLTLIFSEPKIQNTRQAVALIGEAPYFQKYFDTIRSGKSTNLLLTSDQVIVGHTQSDYIATKSQELKLDSTKYFLDRDEIRSSNFVIASYAPKVSKGETLSIPLFVLIFIFGFSFLIIGILLSVLKPIENEQRKADIFKKVFDEVQKPKSPTATTSVQELEINQEEKEIQNFALDETPGLLKNKNSIEIQDHDFSQIMNEIPLQKKVELEVSREIPAEMPAIFNLIGKKKIAMGEVVDLALKNLSAEIEKSGVFITQKNESDKSYECDVDRFRKAFENIFMNSIEARAKNISIRVYNDQSESNQPVNIDIVDDGRGLEPGTMDKIWQPFYGTKDKLKHKGLGLSEALSVFRRYGADVRILENPKIGVTVRIEMDSESRRAHQGQRAGDAAHFEDGDSIVINESGDDIDIDAILNLRDEEESTDLVKPISVSPKIDLEQEFTTTQFKMDETVSVLSHPEIKIEKAIKPIDHFAVKVRKPGRT